MKSHGNDFHDSAVSDHGSMSGLTDDDHTQYLLVDGTRAMTGDLDMGTGLKITLEQNVAHPKRYQIRPQSTFLDIWDNLYNRYAWVRVYKIMQNVFDCGVSTFYFDLYNSSGSFCIFRARKGGTLTEVARLQSVIETSDPYFQISQAGDITMLADKTVDCQTNGGELHPARVSASAEPTPSTHELQVWRDPDDNKTYLIYNDTDEGVRKVEMT